jgi:hypothetical protein
MWSGRPRQKLEPQTVAGEPESTAPREPPPDRTLGPPIFHVHVYLDPSDGLGSMTAYTMAGKPCR